MHRIDTPDNVGSLPSLDAVGTAGFFTKGTTGINDATVPGQDWFNMVQEELNHVVEESGLTPDQNKVNFSQLKQALDLLYINVNDVNDVPIGTVLHGYYSIAPAGFIELNGALLNRSSDADLWSYIQSLESARAGILITDAAWTGDTNNRGLFSSGDGSSTFRLADLRDIFSRSKSAARALGSYEDDEFKSHIHTTFDGFNQAGSGVGYNQSGVNSIANGTGSAGGTETRPKNIALMFCIKR